jgi:UPF0716 protein FxsA
MIRLFLLFTLVPALELFLLLQIGAWLGPLTAFALVLGTGVAGAWLARRQGVAVVLRLVRDAQQGVPPAEALVEGALVVVGGLLLVTPGVLTDLAGVVLLLPAVRRWLAPRVLRRLVDSGRIHGTHVVFGTPRPIPPDSSPARRRPPSEPTNPFDHPVAP